MERKRNCEGSAVTGCERVGEVQIDEVRIVDHFATFGLAMLFFVVTDEMTVGMEPAVAAGDLEASGRGENLPAFTESSAVAGHARAAGSDAALGER